MAKDINIHVKTPGADKAKQDLDGVGRSARKVGDSAGEGGRKGAAGVRKLGDEAKKTNTGFGKLATSIATWVAGLAGIGAIIREITSAIRIQMQAIKEHGDIAAAHQKELLGLQFLGDLFKAEDVREKVRKYSELGGRGVIETGQAYKALLSKGATLTNAQQEGIMKEVLEFGRQEPTAPLTDLVDMFTLYVKQTKATDINLVQNILRQTIEEAGVGTAGEVARYFPRFLPIGIAAGLTGPQAAGLWAFSTGQLGSVEEATTGLRNAFLSLSGKGPAGKEAAMMMGQLGITPDMGFFEKIASLSAAQQAGKFGSKEAELIAGREGMTILLSMLKDPQGLGQQISNIQQVARGDIDFTAEALRELMSTDEFARLEEQGRMFDVQIENIKGGDINALRWRTFFREYELRMRKGGMSEYRIRKRLGFLRTRSGLGFKPPYRVLDPGARSLDEEISAPRGWFWPQSIPLTDFEPAQTNINNHNDYSQNFFPVVGSDSDRGIGPRTDPNDIGR